MLAGEDVETPAWHGRGIEGMLGCSPGAGGRGRGIGLMGGNPGEVCFWPSCGVSLASGSAAGRFGTGASGKVSSAAAISGGSAGGRRRGGGRIGGGRRGRGQSGERVTLCAGAATGKRGHTHQRGDEPSPSA